jgi:phage terminase large subunit
MTTVDVQVPPKLIDVFSETHVNGQTVKYRGAFGGRGSGKTRTFAKMAAIKAHIWATDPARLEDNRAGIVLCGREFMNSLADSSMEEIKQAIYSEAWLLPHFDIGENYIRTRNRRVRFEFVGLRHSLDSLKSKSRILICWVDEAENVSETAWQKLIPTLREDESEIWVTWNPESDRSATHKRFRETPPDDGLIVELNWRDNPWFPDVLNRERLADLTKRPDSYDHIWEGDFVTIREGSYFARHLSEAKNEERITKVVREPLMQLRAYWDIGGTGTKADATAIWIVQFVGQRILVLDYYEAIGQPLDAHLNWLRSKGYGEALCVLPHDGAQHDKIIQTTYEGSIRKAGFDCRVIPNQGAGAAMQRIERVRELFNRCWFDDVPTEPGRKSLGAYHEKRDDNRKIGLGPNHDWASHGADAFGLMALDYKEPRSTAFKRTSIVMPALGTNV